LQPQLHDAQSFLISYLQALRKRKGLRQ
jgi:hypothetical protein